MNSAEIETVFNESGGQMVASGGAKRAEADPVDNRALSKRNFASFSVVMALVGFATVGLGAVDLIMIAPKGVDHVAAVGLGELIVVAVFSFFIGLVDSFGSRLAIAEGSGKIGRRLPVLVAVVLLIILLFQVSGVVANLGLEPALRAIGQDPRIIPLVGDYTSARVYGITSLMLSACSGTALRICGAKTQAVVVLTIGFVANGVLDWLFLYTGVAHVFVLPESAVAWATVLAQTVNAAVGCCLLIRCLRVRGEHLVRPHWREIITELRSMFPATCGFGARILNGYVSATVPVLFIGTLGSGAVAATAAGTKLYVLYCRIPQACFESSLFFYGYAYGNDRSTLVRTARTLRNYSAAPTVIATVAVVAASPWLIGVFIGNGFAQGLALVMFLAYMISIPPYFFEEFLARLLTVHQQGRLLFVSSLLAYAVAIPLAWFAVFELRSPFLAIASRGLVNLIVAMVFWQALRKRCWQTSELQLTPDVDFQCSAISRVR